MFSHGSSARVGVGKRGHGGRPYRPPRKRRDPNSAPPPLKECDCLVEVDLPEYANALPEGGSRQHLCLGGRQGMDRCHTTLRRDFQVHFMVPGRKQAGPVAIVAPFYRQAMPALAYFLHSLVGLSSTEIRGRIHVNVKEPNSQPLPGTFGSSSMPLDAEIDSEMLLQRNGPMTSGLPYWLFQSPTWSVTGCSLKARDDQRNIQQGDNSRTTASPAHNNPAETVAKNDNDDDMMTMAVLKTCLDNIVFRMGQQAIGKLDIFTDPDLYHAFAAGDPEQAKQLLEEIQTAFSRPLSAEEAL